MARVKRHRRKAKVLDETNPISQGTNFQPTRINMMRAYNYFNENVEVKDARQWVTDYMDTFGAPNDHIKKFNQIDTERIPMWLCVHCHMMNNGLRLDDLDFIKTNDRIAYMLEHDVPQKEERQAMPSEFGNPVIAYVEGLLDQFYNSGYTYVNPKLYDYYKANGIKQSDAKAVREYYLPLIGELTVHPVTPIKKQKAYLEFVSDIIRDSTTYCQTERKVRKAKQPRKKKMKTADQLVAKVQFKAEDTTLKLASLPPTKIVGSATVWLFNTKYKKLTMLTTSGDNKLGIRGTSVTGFDGNLSKAKTIRKPEKNLIALMDLPRVAMVKQFLALKTREQPANGRISKDTIILRVS
jgi:hypothetical protein